MAIPGLQEQVIVRLVEFLSVPSSRLCLASYQQKSRLQPSPLLTLHFPFKAIVRCFSKSLCWGFLALPRPVDSTEAWVSLAGNYLVAPSAGGNIVCYSSAWWPGCGYEGSLPRPLSREPVGGEHSCAEGGRAECHCYRGTVSFMGALNYFKMKQIKI